MDILIVEQAPDSTPHIDPRYRGAGRTGPLYFDVSPNPGSELDQLFRWYMDEDAKGALHDPAAARHLSELLHRFDPRQKYEIIEFVHGEGTPSVGTTFLGFDLIQGHGSSLIQWGLKSFASNLVVPQPIRDLSDLINFTFAAHLNAQGLFQTFELASLCLRSMAALQHLHPNFYEGGEWRFRVVGIYHVPIDEPKMDR